MRVLIAVTAVALAVAPVACGGSAKETAPPQSGNGATLLLGPGGAQALSVPYAPAGTRFDVRLDEPIDTRLNSAGQRITATLMQPIVASDGTVFIPQGTQIEGAISSIGTTGGPHIALEFDTAKLPGGEITLGTRIVSAQQSTYRTLPGPAGVTNAQPPGTDGGAPASQPSLQLMMPSGATVQLALTRPIVLGSGGR